ncbi:MAG: DUF5615 family PIN-like protein [Acidobacteriota bacterium]
MKPPIERLFAAIYTDEDVPHLLAVLLRERGFDAASVAEWQTWGLDDEAQLALATRKGHTLLSFNRDDFIAIAGQWYHEGKEHAGIILAPQVPLSAIGRMVLQVSRLLDTIPADEMWNTVRYLQSYR